MFDEIEREKIGVAEFCKEAHSEEGEKYYHRCGEEDPLPAVFVKKVEGAYGTEDFGETGDPRCVSGGYGRA